MKVISDRHIHLNNYIYKDFTPQPSANVYVSNHTTYPEQNLSAVNFPNISFHGYEEKALLEYSYILKCAYTGRDMIPKEELKKIYSKLAKRPNAQSAINFLQGYKKYMYDVESSIFELFEDTPHKNKKDFSDILTEYAPDAIERLKVKQNRVLDSSNYIIDTLSKDTAELVRFIIDSSKKKIEEGSFTRKYPLDLLNNIKGTPSDRKKLVQIYRIWYKLPRSSRDMDAFIVSYAKLPHSAIAKRLLGSAAATIEHIKPQSRGGKDSRVNYVLTCAQVNNDRNSMPLDEYIMLNPELEIPKHLQEYIDDVIRETKIKNSPMSESSWYAEAVRNSIAEETSGFVMLNTSGLSLSKAQIKTNNSPYTLGEKYKIKNK